MRSAMRESARVGVPPPGIPFAFIHSGKSYKAGTFCHSAWYWIARAQWGRGIATDSRCGISVWSKAYSNCRVRERARAEWNCERVS